MFSLLLFIDYCLLNVACFRTATIRGRIEKFSVKNEVNYHLGDANICHFSEAHTIMNTKHVMYLIIPVRGKVTQYMRCRYYIFIFFIMLFWLISEMFVNCVDITDLEIELM